ncbi:hypothetical protein PsorP6_000784 [Peronosclerospora sorghi]|uniref:Uncharacterized protein n=1 Tax=Peronosclerospora sorghi TaxID=230839 RepID=A0ACC0WVS8_9STRA|nr:hypothetical protein PsorP6_000784 [Peronosclerospora sorghi]
MYSDEYYDLLKLFERIQRDLVHFHADTDVPSDIPDFVPINDWKRKSLLDCIPTREERLTLKTAKAQTDHVSMISKKLQRNDTILADVRDCFNVLLEDPTYASITWYLVSEANIVSVNDFENGIQHDTTFIDIYVKLQHHYAQQAKWRHRNVKTPSKQLVSTEGALSKALELSCVQSIYVQQEMLQCSSRNNQVHVVHRSTGMSLTTFKLANIGCERLWRRYGIILYTQVAEISKH